MFGPCGPTSFKYDLREEIKMKNPHGLSFVMSFDPGDSVAFFRRLNRLASAFYAYVRHYFPELWERSKKKDREESEGVTIEFREVQKDTRMVICVTVKLVNLTKEVSVECDMDVERLHHGLPCKLTVVDHSVGKTVRYNCSIEGDTMVKHGLL